MRNKRIYNRVDDLTAITGHFFHLLTLSNLKGTLTLFTSINPQDEPVYISYIEENNDQERFANLVFEVCSCNYLKAGDYLILDNASLHVGDDTARYVKQILDAAGVTMIYLPAYSPELNPCELCFSIIKGYIRRHARRDDNLFNAMMEGITKVTLEKLENFYQHCVHPNVILPDVF